MSAQSPRRLTSDQQAASRVLQCWRHSGPGAASDALCGEQQSGAQGLLIQELTLRLQQKKGPRLLIDGLWFSRPYGGITRVWEQLLASWALPGMITPEAPVAVIDRGSCLAAMESMPTLEGRCVDPLDVKAVAALAEDNARQITAWSADVFCSSWISVSGLRQPSCPELALVHDCLPERLRSSDQLLLQQRRRWWSGAGATLSVSADTARDVRRLRGEPEGASELWCHPSVSSVFEETVRSPQAPHLWDRLRAAAGLRQPYVLLPATSALGSYKNPELLGSALEADALQSLQLVLCGIAADQRVQELKTRFPRLGDRILAAGFTDPELALVYQHALAVVIPSRIEGFGLPAIEVMASGGLPLVADVRGLREAGAEAALRFAPDQPHQLTAWLKLLLNAPSRAWIEHHLQARIQRRLARLNPDLLGVTLLAQARALNLLTMATEH